MTETETERIDNIVEDLTQSAAADALLGACSACSHPSCERKRQAERDTQIAGQELATYIATLRAQLAGVRERQNSGKIWSHVRSALDRAGDVRVGAVTYEEESAKLDEIARTCESRILAALGGDA